jgi:repressor LexA
MNTLSLRQQNILRFIISFFERNKFPPTIREIGDEVGISSTSVVNYNLNKLEDLELVARQREVSRGISLNWPKLLEFGFSGSRLNIPILGKIQAGEPIQVEPNEATNPEGWIELAEGIVGNGASLFALRVVGDSMIDASVLDGDIVILRHQETANDGDMVAAWLKGEGATTLKYFYRQGKEIRLQPANPDPVYKPIVRSADDVIINGKVVSVIRVYH